MVGSNKTLHKYSVNVYFQSFQITINMLDKGKFYPVQLHIVLLDGLKETVRYQYLGQNNLRPTKSLTNIAIIQNLKTLKDKLLNLENKITTTKAITSIIGGTGGISCHRGAPMVPAILNSALSDT